MTDSVYVLPPGERLTDDSTGAPISGATLYFYDAQTTTPKTVYADADLTVELGTSVVTDSLGYPTSDGAARTLIYVGTARYKFVAKDAAGNTLFTHDDIPGAVVSASSVDVSVTATFPVVTKSLDYAVVAADQNSTFLINCSSADVMVTLPSAVDVGNGFAVKVQHAGSANQAIIVVKSGSGQNIYEGTKTYGGASFALALNGEDCEVVSDGGNWRVTSHTPPFIKLAQGIIPVVSRVSTSPASPQAGDIYLLTGVGGDFSTFTSGDLAQYTGAGWINWTPKAGWRVWVAGESLYYSYISSAWAAEGATTSQTGTVVLADSPTMETATDLSKAVTPGRQHMHPGHPKVWGNATVSSGTPTLQSSYNMTSITDSGTGNLSMTIATDFSSAQYASLISVANDGVANVVQYGSVTAGSFSGQVQRSSSEASNDPAGWSWEALGDQ